jgi:hypothetical protein
MTRQAPNALADLADQRSIYELVCRYCRSVDRLDYDGVRSVYAPDGVDHHTGFSGPADEYVAFLRRVLPILDGSQHIIGNHLCQLFGDEAVSETYGTAVHWGSPADDATKNFTSGFRYVDHLVRLDCGWRIRERWAVREWTRSDAGLQRQPEGTGPRGQRDAGDPVLRLLARFIGN